MSQRGTGRPSSFYTINAADPQHLIRLQLFRKSGATLPSERRGGIVPLAALPVLETADIGEGTPEQAVIEDPVLGPLLQLLRPAEAVILGAGRGQSALALASTARAIGLDCLFVAASGADTSIRRALQRQIAQTGVNLRLLRADGGVWPEEVQLAVDLVQLGPEASGFEAWQMAFRILRPGGFLLGHGPADAALEHFVTASGSTLLRLPEPGTMVGWVVEKGLGLGRVNPADFAG